MTAVNRATLRTIAAAAADVDADDRRIILGLAAMLADSPALVTALLDVADAARWVLARRLPHCEPQSARDAEEALREALDRLDGES